MVSLRLAPALTTWLSAIATAFAGQVDWSSTAFSIHQQSDGSPLDDSFIFELGAFAEGFTPTADNVTEWAANWRAAQRAPYNPNTQTVSGSFVIETNASPFSTADQGYLWALSLDHPQEWILLTNTSWKWPSVGGAAPPVSWTIQNADTVLLGQTNPDGTPFFLQMGTVPVSTPTPWITGDQWRSENFTTTQITDGTAGWLNDPDGDGKSNLDEMAAGTNPLSADPVQATTTRLTDQGVLEMTVAKVPNAVLEYKVQVSDNLIDWFDSTDDDIQVLIDSANRFIVRDRTPVTIDANRFIRLQVSID